MCVYLNGINMEIRVMKEQEFKILLFFCLFMHKNSSKQEIYEYLSESIA